MLPKASPNKHTIMNAALGILFNNLALLPVHYENQVPIEELYGTEMPRERQHIEQELPSPTLYTTIPVVDGQDERTEVQLVHGALNAQAHQAPSTVTQYQAAEDLDSIKGQLGPEYPRQDATISPCIELNFREVVMHNLLLPHFFDNAFKDYSLGSLNHKSQTNVEEARADSYEQHLNDLDYTESFGNNPIV
jgi:hypothetical protein